MVDIMGNFKKASDKYNDLHSSSICLLFVGIIGTLYVILDYFKVFPFSFIDSGNFLFYIVMGSLFVIFIIVGLYTAKSAKKVKETISDEETNTDSIITWAIDNLSSTQLDSLIEDIDDCGDEEKYLLRTATLEGILKKEFELEDEAYINSLIDEIYPELYE